MHVFGYAFEVGSFEVLLEYSILAKGQKTVFSSWWSFFEDMEGFFGVVGILDVQDVHSYRVVAHVQVKTTLIGSDIPSVKLPALPREKNDVGDPFLCPYPFHVKGTGYRVGIGHNLAALDFLFPECILGDVLCQIHFDNCGSVHCLF